MMMVYISYYYNSDKDYDDDGENDDYCGLVSL